jgi:hypothetical protein
MSPSHKSPLPRSLRALGLLLALVPLAAAACSGSSLVDDTDDAGQSAAPQRASSASPSVSHPAALRASDAATPTNGSACTSDVDCDTHDPCTSFKCVVAGGQEFASGTCVLTPVGPSCGEKTDASDAATVRIVTTTAPDAAPAPPPPPPPPPPTTCSIGGSTYFTGQVNPANMCQTCQPATSASSWTANSTCVPVDTTPTYDGGVSIVTEGAACTVGQVGAVSNSSVTYCDSSGTGSTFPAGSCTPAACSSCMQAKCSAIPFATPPSAECLAGVAKLFAYFAGCGPDRSSIPMMLVSACDDPGAVNGAVESCKDSCTSGVSGACSFY